jgi:hypothetical protein
MSSAKAAPTLDVSVTKPIPVHLLKRILPMVEGYYQRNSFIVRDSVTTTAIAPHGCL